MASGQQTAAVPECLGRNPEATEQPDNEAGAGMARERSGHPRLSPQGSVLLFQCKGLFAREHRHSHMLMAVGVATTFEKTLDDKGLLWMQDHFSMDSYHTNHSSAHSLWTDNHRCRRWIDSVSKQNSAPPAPRAPQNSSRDPDPNAGNHWLSCLRPGAGWVLAGTRTGL